MFSQISWASYVQIVALILVAYYAFTLYKYYRHDFLHLFKGKQNLQTDNLALTGTNQHRDVYNNCIQDHSDYMPKEELDNEYSLLINTLSDEVKAFILEAGNNSFDKDQILASLQLLLGKYPFINSSPYKESIQNIIKQECEYKCSVHLSEDDLDGLWLQ